MSLKDDAFPSSAAFDIINATLQNSEEDRKEAIEKAKTIVGITLKNSKGQEASWYVDVKEKGVAGKGPAPPGGKADVTLILSDADFGALVTGNANAQRLFMGGKLKIKGNMMKATKIEPVFKKAQSKAKL
ncbi:hypothetical protein MPDQ_000852 [Monascus purpureus]|uniref:SCP2 domain-containing protein n=1 Tax=Monascus purpureus TaxID=5098 RepID=A0A507R355_MONPU|nr:hypothetical protein MPDQ_000852 [Monascus purpureus]BDD55691.1 hypothetical protein MAP00_001180 [Monascus purpureus]